MTPAQLADIREGVAYLSQRHGHWSNDDMAAMLTEVDRLARKLDCLLAAVLERTESAAILARAEAIERGNG